MGVIVTESIQIPSIKMKRTWRRFCTRTRRCLRTLPDPRMTSVQAGAPYGLSKVLSHLMNLPESDLEVILEGALPSSRDALVGALLKILLTIVIHHTIDTFENALLLALTEDVVTPGGTSPLHPPGINDSSP